MASVEVVYSGLIRSTVRCGSEFYELSAGATLRDLLNEVIRRHGPEARRYLFTDDARLVSGASILMGGFAARNLDARIGDDGQVQVVVLSPMMIGG